MSLSNDLLMQILEQQATDSKVLHELKGNLDTRVSKIEEAQTRAWYVNYIVTPFLFIAHATARHFGARI